MTLPTTPVSHARWLESQGHAEAGRLAAAGETPALLRIDFALAYAVREMIHRL